MQIGELARKAGLSVRAIRYYEELGLINPSGHSSGGFRLYGDDCLKRLEVIAYLKGLDLSLTEIRRIFDAKRGSGGSRQAVAQLQEVFAAKLEQVDSKLQFLDKMKSEILQVLHILKSCRSCEHKLLLDAQDCSQCSRLPQKQDIPALFSVLLQKSAGQP